MLGCDGIRSAVRGALAAQGAQVAQRRFADQRPIVYRVLAIPVAQGDRTDLNCSVRSGGVIVEALPNAEGELLGVVLFPPTEQRIEGLSSGALILRASEGFLARRGGEEGLSGRSSVRFPMPMGPESILGALSRLAYTADLG